MDKKIVLTFVVILAITAGIGVAVLVTAWTNPSGNPPAGSGNLSGAIMYFATSTCPSGWSEVVAARGRYIVGLPASGSVSSTVGTALSNLENRAVGYHNHGISISGVGDHTHSYPRATSWNGGNALRAGSSGETQDSTSGAGGHTHSASIDYAGSVAGTNAPYIQFLVCKKD